MKINPAFLQPAFPAIPQIDNFGRISTAFPGMSALEYYTFEFLKLNYSKKVDDHYYFSDAFREAIEFLEFLEQTIKDNLPTQSGVIAKM